jgi:hypothetical protein
MGGSGRGQLAGSPGLCYSEDSRSDHSTRSSAPVGAWLSLVEHLVRDQGVGGSNPLAPTTFIPQLQ